ncbi:hypothetical protein EVAR_77422_1 [Eumeta japonica]|uniref:MADF domain-containing protein n=1 Tax=Eumeta variegata TaxID=151549 RepID=A0A4C1UXF1_EUMVA|nr:hypothetical protein EVAR_77422_1 [Eumeta japonica]
MTRPLPTPVAVKPEARGATLGRPLAPGASVIAAAAEPVIWDPHHIHHKDKKKINDAWGRLSAKLNVPVKELKTKKEILMGTFRRHLKKKQESTRSGARSDDIYEPIWFAYAAMESFLLPVYTTRNTINTETGPSTSQVSKETFSDETSRQLDETFGDETIENIGMETSSPSPSPAIPIAKSRSTSAKAPSLPCT